MIEFITSNSKNPSKTMFSYSTGMGIVEFIDVLTEVNIAIEKLTVQYTNKDNKKVSKPVTFDKFDSIYAKYKFDIWILNLDTEVKFVVRYSDVAQRADIISFDNDQGTVDDLIDILNGGDVIVDEKEFEDFDDDFSEDYDEEEFDDEIGYEDDYQDENDLRDPRSKGKKKNKPTKQAKTKPQKQEKQAVQRHASDKSGKYILFAILEILSLFGSICGVVALVKTFGAKKKLMYDEMAAEDGFRSAKVFLILGAVFAVAGTILVGAMVFVLMQAASQGATPA